MVWHRRVSGKVWYRGADSACAAFQNVALMGVHQCAQKPLNVMIIPRSVHSGGFFNVVMQGGCC